MSKKQPQSSEIYEEWVAHPDLHAYVRLEDREKWQMKPGWWRLGLATAAPANEHTDESPEPAEAA